MIVLVVVAAVLTLGAVVGRWVWEGNRPLGSDVGDTERFRNELGKWERLVFERSGTVRSVKRFANRARFLVGEEPDAMVRALVALIALDELGIVDIWRPGFNFDEWKEEEWWITVEPALPAIWRSRVQEWVAGISESDREVCSLLTLGPPKNVGDAEVIRRRYCVKVARSAEVGERPGVLRPIVGVRDVPGVSEMDLLACRRAGCEILGVYYSDAREGSVKKVRCGMRVYESVEEALREASADAVFDIEASGDVVRDILSVLPKKRAVVLRTLGDDLEQARAVRRICRQRRLIAAVDVPWRYAPFVRGVRSLIEQGWIGELRVMEIRMAIDAARERWSRLRDSRRSSGLYYNINYVDLVCSSMGQPVFVWTTRKFHGSWEGLASTRNDTVLEYGDGRHGTICTTQRHELADDDRGNFVKWRGSDGTIVATIEPFQVQVSYQSVRRGKPQQRVNLELGRTWVRETMVGSAVNMSRYLESKGIELACSLEEGYGTMKVVEAMHRSMEQGCRERVRRVSIVGS